MRWLRWLSLFLFFLCATSARAELRLRDLNDQEIAWSSLKGKWVFINYWASWCHPCLEEIAAFNQFYANRKSEGVEVFAVNFDSVSLEQQRRLVRQFHIRYPSLSHRSAKSLRLGSLSVVPVTFVINPQGELMTPLYGGQSLASLNEVMTSAAKV